MKKLLKTFALFLAICLIATTITALAAENIGFTDVNATDYFYSAVQWGAEAGITQGVGGGLFDSNGYVTRAQLVTFLWRMAGQPEADGLSPFFDVFTESEQWYTKAVIWAANNGIAEGYIEGPHKVFGPDVVCDRAMCMTFLYRFMDSPFDGIDLTADIELNENSTMEEFGFSMIQGMVKGIREQGMLADVPEESYFELPVFWGLLNGIITEDNSGITEENTLFRSHEACVRKEMISFLYQTKLLDDMKNAPAEVYFDEYSIPIPQEYYERLYYAYYGVDGEETGDELLLIVSEGASTDAAEAMGEEVTEEIGELFRIIRINEERLHELLCGDMSGIEVFAKDAEGKYYLFCTPTDVRYVRETNEKMQEDIEEWTELNKWVRGELVNEILKKNSTLTPVSFSNTMLDMYLARIAYAKDVKYTVSAMQYGSLEPGNFDGTKYAEYLLGGNFAEAENTKAPDGEYVVLNFPDEGARYDFFIADRNLVREVRGDYETIYKRVFKGSVTNTEAMEGWYLTIAEQSGKKEDYKELDPFLGEWREEIAGRGTMTITKSVAPAKADIEARWPGSAFEVSTWSITANLTNDGKLVYNDCKHIVTEYDENGNGSVVSEVTDEGGVISLDNEGKIIWKIDDWEEGSTFIKQ